MRLLLLVLLLLIPITSCKTTEDGKTVPDWDAWKAELQAEAGTIARAKEALPEKVEFLDKLEGARANAEKAVAILSTGGDPESALSYLRAAAVIATALSEDEDIRFYAFALGEIVARIEAHITHPPE